jgi:hypothetical protein
MDWHEILVISIIVAVLGIIVFIKNSSEECFAPREEEIVVEEVVEDEEAPRKIIRAGERHQTHLHSLNKTWR